jgi:proline iminopeptidase
MPELFPPVEPYEQGMLDVGDGNHVYWEASGNPAGKPALVVHGGPGSGLAAGRRQYFDPALYRIIQFDQRGCGRSTPPASDPATDMSVNTTAHLITDMERLRRHLGVQAWLLYAASWGTTLSVAYAEQYPERVTELVLTGVAMSRRSEIDWLYRGVGRYFPREWERFLAAAPGTPLYGDVVGAYSRLMEDPDPQVRERAAEAWCAWEDTVLSGETKGASAPYSSRPPLARLGFVRICSWYFAHGAWLAEGALLRDADRLAGIPGVLVHGRLDMGGPLITPWELARAWPDAELLVVEDSGHLGSPASRDYLLEAMARFARD